MLDVVHIPSNTDSTKIFYATSGIGATNGWQTWVKPRNAKFIQIFCLGSGAGGAGGGLQVAATLASGGGGGAASGFMKAVYPTNVLPDILYVQVGVGGVGGVGAIVAGNGQPGVAGSNSYVTISPSSTNIGILTVSNASAPGGGGVTGTGGVVPNITTLGAIPFSQLGIYSIVVGLVGNAAANGTRALTSNIVTGGGGGGTKPVNNQGAGGTILPATAILTTQLDGLVGGGAGGNGYGSMNPFCGTGGAGGGGNLTGSGGKGGNGFYGSGGGGGGGGLLSGASFTGGAGGKGGDGLVIITTIT